MQIVYATASPRFLEFEMTDRREAIPSGATVFAICTGDRTIENQDEDLFAAITDEEYFTLLAMVNKAERLEADSTRQKTSARPLRKFITWLFTLGSNDQAVAELTSCTAPSASYRRREITAMRQS